MPKSKLQKAFEKADGFTKELSASQIKAEIETPRTAAYGTNVRIGTDIPFADDAQKTIFADVYFDGSISVQYGMEHRVEDNYVANIPLTRLFTGFRADKRAKAFIKKKAVNAGLIP
jgi:hypothetical protein